MPTYLRRLDQAPVDALQYTGDNAGQVLAWLGAGYRLGGEGPERLVLTRDHPSRSVEVWAWDWVVRDRQEVYAVRPYAFRSHCHGVPTG